MSRGYDFCPSESDSAILLSQVERMVQDAIEAALKPASRTSSKPKGKQLPKGKGEAKPRLMLSQEHASKRGEMLCSHLIAMPKGVSPADNLDLKNVFNQHPFHDDWVRDGWNIIHDRSLNAQYPEHDIYWLCSADWLSEPVVKAVVTAAIKVEKDEPAQEKISVRKVTNEIVLG
jgi:hypothetical protein